MEQERSAETERQAREKREKEAQEAKDELAELVAFEKYITSGKTISGVSLGWYSEWGNLDKVEKAEQGALAKCEVTFRDYDPAKRTFSGEIKWHGEVECIDCDAQPTQGYWIARFSGSIEKHYSDQYMQFYTDEWVKSPRPISDEAADKRWLPMHERHFVHDGERQNYRFDFDAKRNRLVGGIRSGYNREAITLTME